MNEQYTGYKIAYENARGQKLVLTELPYRVNIESLMNYEWTYATKDRRRGQKIVGFSKGINSKTIPVFVTADSVYDRNKAADDFHNVIEACIYDGKAGKLWLNDEWYTYCYMIAANNSKWQYGTPYMRKDMEIVWEQETWYRVTSIDNYQHVEEMSKPLEEMTKDELRLYADENGIKGITSGMTKAEMIAKIKETLKGWKHYEDLYGGLGYDYDYDYMTDKRSLMIANNPNPLGAQWIIEIFGPVVNPTVKIGDTLVRVLVTVPDGATLAVDTIEKSITLVYPTGDKVNVFGRRDPYAGYIFRPIETGEHIVEWSGAFKWRLTMIEERSEPKWHMA